MDAKQIVGERHPATGEQRSPPDSGRRSFWRWTLAATAAATALRLRFLFTPLTPDEAGAIVVARAWTQGSHLYTDVFIDRPQGVVWLFQRWMALAGPTPASIRVLAILAGAVAVIATAAVARSLTGSWRAGAIAAWVAAIVGASPAIEGYAANGELLAGASTTVAMALGAAVIVRRAPVGAMVAAGAFAAAGISMKQSGYDALVALGLWLALAHARRWMPRSQVVLMAGLLAAGAVTVAAGLALHGATLGWDAYWYAVAGFRLHARSAVAGGRWGHLLLAALVAAPLLVPPVAAVVGRLPAPGRVRRTVRPLHALALCWLVVACMAFLTGGNFHRHYWIQIVYPLAVVLAVAATLDHPDPAEASGRTLRTLLVRALALPLVVSLAIIVAPGIERDRRADADRAIARWLDTQPRAEDRALLLPLCASATFYAAADQAPPVPYLWVDHVRSARGATENVVRLLDGPNRPEYLALHQRPSACDPSGQIQQAIDQHYRPALTIEGVAILAAKP